MDIGSKTLKKINCTAKETYKFQGAGIGTGEEASKRYPPDKDAFVLDIGFGDCKLVKNIEQYTHHIFGIDIAEASIEKANKEGLTQRFFVPLNLDVSHDKIPFVDNFFDYVYCLETMEHLSNPFFVVAEIKRVLKHNGKFIITFPMPEKNLGYEGGQHAHVYPGFLQRESFKQFMMQLYFKCFEHIENGDTSWNVYINKKEGDMVFDAFHIITDNATKEELYGWLL